LSSGANHVTLSYFGMHTAS